MIDRPETPAAGHPPSGDTVVCTLGLCAIPDFRTAIVEMITVLRPGGLLLLADCVPSRNPLVPGRAVARRGHQRPPRRRTLPTPPVARGVGCRTHDRRARRFASVSWNASPPAGSSLRPPPDLRTCCDFGHRVDAVRVLHLSSLGVWELTWGGCWWGRSWPVRSGRLAGGRCGGAAGAVLRVGDAAGLPVDGVPPPRRCHRGHPDVRGWCRDGDRADRARCLRLVGRVPALARPAVRDRRRAHDRWRSRGPARLVADLLTDLRAAR